MTEVTDIVLPILQKIQKDLSDTRRSLEAKINDVADTTLKTAERVEAIEGYLAFSMGVLSQHQVDIPAIQQKFKSMEARLRALETKV